MTQPGLDRGFAYRPVDPFDEAAREKQRYDAERDRRERNERPRAVPADVARSKLDLGGRYDGSECDRHGADLHGPVARIRPRILLMLEALGFARIGATRRSGPRRVSWL